MPLAGGPDSSGDGTPGRDEAATHSASASGARRADDDGDSQLTADQYRMSAAAQGARPAGDE
ncbi:hypothetical protein [Luteimonas sp. MHLX1A]|uniref:hypothetical protein n=1 Tax=Alterluteimonas muca TaxID=2878684 RepID=UPI001E53AEF9|nr:hypothetical protein [Luteimonas sp. MHLX1A]MCD9045483.1 hypothetical protein [Luteimonas sp. MHLX1A]